jgi:hypothetical protein
MVVYAGWQLECYLSGSTVNTKLDGVQKVTYHLINNSEAKDECGTRFPTYIIEGNYATAGDIERFYTGSGAWAMFEGTGSTTNSELRYMNLFVYPLGSGSSRPFICINNIKMNKVSENHKLGSAVMMETWDFIGLGTVVRGTTGA